MEQDEAVGGEDLADLEAGAVQRSSGEEVRGAVRPAELPRLGGAAPAGGTSQARRSSAGGWTFRRGGAEPARELQLAPSGTRSFQAASRGRRSRFFSPPYPFGSIWVAPSASAREIERARAAPSASAREIAGIGTASASAPPRAPPRRLRSA